MPKPSHVEAFEFFTEGESDRIRDHIAFGLFMDAEREWALKSETTRTDAEYKRYHENLLTPTQRQQFRSAAIKVLDDFAFKAIKASSRHSGNFDLLGHSKPCVAQQFGA